MKNIMFSGPDGTGKSTIIKEVKKSFEKKGIDIEIVWLRFFHYTSKIVNLFGKILGKSYKEKYSWGEVGYHNYEGWFGIIYTISVWTDYNIFRLFIKNKKLKKDKFYLIDRYILDVVADLIVDTKNEKLVFLLFDKYITKEISNINAYILECDVDIVKKRRKDIIDDQKYLEKVKAYKILANRYNIDKLNTGEYSIEEIIKKITN